MVTKHHRQCKSNGGEDTRTNIRKVCQTKHVAWHTLFQNWLPPVICRVINHTWLDPRWKFICVKTENFGHAKRLLGGLVE